MKPAAKRFVLAAAKVSILFSKSSAEAAGQVRGRSRGACRRLRIFRKRLRVSVSVTITKSFADRRRVREHRNDEPHRLEPAA